MSIAAGFRFLHVGRTAGGYLVGGLTVAANGGQPIEMVRLEGAQTVPIGVVEDELLTVMGDDGPLVTFDFEGPTLPSGVLEMAARNADFEAVAQGTKVQALALGDVGALAAKGGTRSDLCFLMQRVAKTWEPGDRGSGAWEILLVLGAKVRPLYSQLTQRAHNPYRYSINTSKVARKPWGEPFTVLDNGATSMPLAVMDSPYPILLEATLGDGTEDEFTLNNTPVNGATSLMVYVEGVLQTITTHYTYAAGEVTFTGGNIPAAGEHIVFVIQVDPSALEE